MTAALPTAESHQRIAEELDGEETEAEEDEEDEEEGEEAEQEVANPGPDH